MTVNNHCINVAKYSLAICDKLHIACKRDELIRGALLHDYFLYDWHHGDYAKPHKLHGFYHPGRALRNAMKEYALTPREQDIIKNHKTIDIKQEVNTLKRQIKFWQLSRKKL